MPNKDIIIKKLADTLSMSNEFIQVIDEADLKLRIPSARSNTIGGQIVCIARARDAYTKSILTDQPFSWCPDFDYNDRYNQEKVNTHLVQTKADLIKALNTRDTLSDNQLELILDLISHEALHHGQLIRYIYANALTMPSSLKSFWHLED